MLNFSITRRRTQLKLPEIFSQEKAFETEYIVTINITFERLIGSI